MTPHTVKSPYMHAHAITALINYILSSLQISFTPFLGAVPDRGGRSNEIRPKALSSGGGGGGRGGGRGRGGGGRGRNNGGNSGGGRDNAKGRGKSDGGRQDNKRSKRDEAKTNADQRQEETKN
jgi:hypothetical protein